MHVESFLTGKSFSIDRNINAKAMDTHGAKVAKTLMDAQKKKKKKMTVRLRPSSQNVTLAVITRAYMNDGGGKKKGKKGKKAESAERDPDVWAGFAQFEQHAPAEEPVKPPPSKEPVSPTSGAPSTSGAAVDVEAERKADHAFVREKMPPGWDGNPDEVIEASRNMERGWPRRGTEILVLPTDLQLNFLSGIHKIQLKENCCIESSRERQAFSVHA
jgi:hypothetical protein